MEAEQRHLIRDAVVEDAAAIASVQVSSWQTTYRGIVDPDFLQAMNLKPRQEMWEQALSASQERSVTLVLEDETGETSGFLKAGPSRSSRSSGSDTSAELYVLYLLERCQGKGFGREMFRIMLERLQVMGYQDLHVWVLEQNPAVHFYARMGGQDYGVRETITIGSGSHVELSLEWKDIGAL